MNTERVSNHIVSWLKEYAKKANVTGFVVGVSGGIDSAVTSTLCAKTGLHTLCVEMPIHQSESQVIRGQKHIEHLKSQFKNVSATKVDLTSTFEAFKNANKQEQNTPKLDLALANTRARLRMSSLYYLAGLHGLLVAGTGNKIEDFGVGFYTKYGDGGVDLSPIADLLKSEVYQLATHLNVINSIQNAAPTDGLFGDSRTDEDQIGASYDELEWAMKMKVQDKTPQDFSGRQLEVFTIYTRLNMLNQHKMNPIPVCIINNDLK